METRRCFSSPNRVHRGHPTVRPGNNDDAFSAANSSGALGSLAYRASNPPISRSTSCNNLVASPWSSNRAFKCSNAEDPEDLGLRDRDALFLFGATFAIADLPPPKPRAFQR